MSQQFDFTSAGAEFDDSGFFTQSDAGNAFVDSLLEFTAYGDGYNAFTDVQQNAEEEWEDEVDEGNVFFNQAFEPTFEQQSDFEDNLATTSPSPSLASPTPSASASASEALSDDSAISLSNSLDDVGAIILNNSLCAPLATLTTANYTPDPSVLTAVPEATPDPTAIYDPLTTLHFRTSANAKAHRRRARLPPKSQALDVARVKHYGRDYWVRRIYNAMIDIRYITDGDSSIHRARFTQTRAFHALDLEATAHHIFDEAIAVHERGWIRPTVYHKKVVRGKLIDLSENSLEMRLSRICLCLQQKKSSVDDAIRGGVTLALLCDNPEARSFTKASNDVGNKKRGMRLKETSTKEKAKKKAQVAQAHQQDAKVQVEGVPRAHDVREQVGVREE
ncbi:hypothetical protein BU25DRAFT_472731 [Macroventuria anomochaeta]|uniref:Uncharacterized protein n=1 Tax=Macroventuria anomochaeta TaxID=301207 RepID=A0ACB6RYH8_9PLEO|nr:uncharacterized protein BU25DRAFT_472731 [Macroventuria anomochaeta]KAF2625927.1 hypothetical protein BU25DRAFT_472731 [Macroventuria anomochaeta]